MAGKPSLYVVEKKEVVILVTLFIVITVLSFTLGVKYGETIGRREKKIELDALSSEKIAAGGGSLKDARPSGEAALGEDKSATAETDKEGSKEHDAATMHSVESKSEHGEELAKATHRPETAAELGHDERATKSEKAEMPKTEVKAATKKEKTDVNSDEYLIDALKENQIESMGAKGAENKELPQETKKPKSGTYVIQVGSHPTKNEADSQLKALKAKRVEAVILPPFKDGQGEWYRVVIQGFKVKRDAEKEAKAYKNKGVILSYYVWKLP